MSHLIPASSMSISGEVFEPKVIYNILKGLRTSESEKKSFAKWNENVCTNKSIHLPLSSFLLVPGHKSCSRLEKAPRDPVERGSAVEMGGGSD